MTRDGDILAGNWTDAGDYWRKIFGSALNRRLPKAKSRRLEALRSLVRDEVAERLSPLSGTQANGDLLKELPEVVRSDETVYLGNRDRETGRPTEALRSEAEGRFVKNVLDERLSDAEGGALEQEVVKAAGEAVDKAVERLENANLSRTPVRKREKTDVEMDIDLMTNRGAATSEDRAAAKKRLDDGRAARKAATAKYRKDTEEWAKSTQREIDELAAAIRGTRAATDGGRSRRRDGVLRAAWEVPGSSIYVPTGITERVFVGPEWEIAGFATGDGKMEVDNEDNPELDPFLVPIPSGGRTRGKPGDPVYVTHTPSEGEVIVDGVVYREEQVLVNRLRDLSDAAMSASDDIQIRHVMETGRTMDRDVAAIRALLSVGEITRDEARKIAWELRESRDVSLAKELARRHGGPWGDYYFETTKDTLGLRESLRKQDTAGKYLLDAMNEDSLNYRVANKIPEANAKRRRRNMFIAHRYGLAPELANNGVPEEVTVDTDDWRYTRGGLAPDVVPSRDLSLARRLPSWEVPDGDWRSQASLAARVEKGRLRPGAIDLDDVRKELRMPVLKKAKRYLRTGRWVLSDSPLADPTFRREVEGLDGFEEPDLDDALFILGAEH